MITKEDQEQIGEAIREAWPTLKLAVWWAFLYLAAFAGGWVFAAWWMGRL